MKKCLILGLVLTACGQSSEDSETKWAHASTERSWGTIPALVDYLDLGFKANFSKIRVCLQSSDSYQSAPLLLETKLAYAAWLSASGKGNQTTWDKFQFEVKTACDPRDTNYGSVVIIEAFGKSSPKRNPGEAFNKAKVSCQKSGYGVSCGTGSVTMGWGGPSAISYSYLPSGRWQSVTSHAPATVRLSPYVKWRPLDADLRDQKALPMADRTAKLEIYRRLLAKVNTVRFSELLYFMNELSVSRMVAVSDPNFQKLMQDFQQSGASSLNKEYLPIATAFHVLLHEVGHQFGMDHADNPSRDSETGYVIRAQQRGDQWTTSEASMAYGKPFLYLTHDDQAGVLDLSQKTRKSLSARR